MADLYALLGVGRDATQDDIKRAYRRKARELHPDTGGDEAAFKEVTRAYEILTDADRRMRYDRFGDEGSGRIGDPFASAAGFGDLSDVINAFFGGGGFGGATSRPRARAQEVGRDVLVGVELELEEVATGVRRDLEVQVAVACDVCAATGSRSKAAPSRCSTCGGSGQVQRVVRSAFGQIATARPCPTCDGTGSTVTDPCPSCSGEGRRVERRTVAADIPAGVDEGDRLRVPNAGEAGRLGAPSGDLYVEIRIRPHEFLVRDGRDLWCDVSVPVVHAALGAKLDVPTLGGATVEIDLHAGTQPEEVITLRRAGLPARGGYSPGDLNVRVHVEVPRHLDDAEAELLRRFTELRGEEAPPAGRGLFQRLREAFR